MTEDRNKIIQEIERDYLVNTILERLYYIIPSNDPEAIRLRLEGIIASLINIMGHSDDPDMIICAKLAMAATNVVIGNKPVNSSLVKVYNELLSLDAISREESCDQ